MPSSLASLCRQIRLVRRNYHGSCARLGDAFSWTWWRVLLDHRRHGFSKEGQAFGGRCPPVLRSTGQARQLPTGGQPVAGKRSGPVSYTHLTLPTILRV